MLELESVRWKNFLSYGDYWTELGLAGLGQCLITGEILDQDDLAGEDRQQASSNGAGKSTVPNAILWGLFGRTMHSAQPGDRVRNYWTDGDCTVEVLFKGGDRVCRTYTKEGKTELLYSRAGQEETYTADTLSTGRAMQARLSKELGLDWDLFCGSVFFSQYGRPWMEMPDQQRKAAMERILRVDRYNLYAEVAREKAAKVDAERTRRRDRLDYLSRTLLELQDEIRELEEARAGFEANKSERHRSALREAELAEAERDALRLPDLDQLRVKWEVVAQIEAKIQAGRSEAGRLSRLAGQTQVEANSRAGEARDHRRKIGEWSEQGGKLCLACEQLIPHSHVTQKVAPHLAATERLEAERDRLQAQADEFKRQAAALEHQSAQLADRLRDRQPKQTVRDAELVYRERETWDREARRARDRAGEILAEQDPYGPRLERAEARSLELQAESQRLARELEQFGLLWATYSYIGKSYGDRRKIKAYAFRERVPFVNARLAHYLEVFGLDVGLEFTDSLGIKSDRWGYDFFCGGERKRVDIALMLAIFDLHEHMYGRQCNVVVLDEVDSRMDARGVDSLVQIIRTELAAKVEAVLIISHKSSMFDQFPRQLTVRRRDRLSFIEEVR